ncbi:hypothetical protein UFOVP1636_237 [uncultured Caudovirales phage]|uniref:Uncharacterized protein n=1 Tax=uncultured Caudovirales phage TaxID=2100421 RepID=A0A6J5T2V8_9CAUD|nr:hypothetical protein UFOVP1636_237 [uncultured Caudovirales phage]
MSAILKDYKHASQLYVGDGYRLLPKFGFLFHVFIDINTGTGGTDRSNPLATAELGMLVKSADLPKYSMETKTFNTYNRASIVQSKVKYDPITIVFNDDSSNVVRNFWEKYFKYYYRDGDYELTQDGMAQKYSNQQITDFGLSPINSMPFLKAIRIYSLHKKQFSEYILVNPVIKSFRHGQHQQGENETMKHEMTVEYEAVIYQSGTTRIGDTPKGIATLHYDTTSSPIRSKTGYRVPSGNSLFNSFIPRATNSGIFGNKMFASMVGLNALRSGSLKNALPNDLNTAVTRALRQGNPNINTFIPSILNSNGMISTPFGGINVKNSIIKLINGQNPLPTEVDLKRGLKSIVGGQLNSFTRVFPRNSIGRALAQIAVTKTMKIVNDELFKRAPSNQRRVNVPAQKRSMDSRISSLTGMQKNVSDAAARADTQLKNSTASLAALNSKLAAANALPDTNPTKATLLAQLERNVKLQTNIKDKATAEKTRKTDELVKVTQQLAAAKAEKDLIK